MLGSVLGQYRITGEIGRGGMGVVYAAQHVLLERPAAVKVLAPELSQNRDIVTRFFNEARAATAIRNPGIVEIYDFGYSGDGSAFIAMEFLEGESLSARLEKGRPTQAQLLAVARQVAGTLAAAHAKGIVHRDLKPDNIFLVSDPEVPGGERTKLLDFGIAKLATEQGQSKTRTGTILGTPGYMSPEQCRGVAVDHRADLYSLGCMLFEMVTGRQPFSGEGAGDVLAAHIYMAPPQMGSIAPGASPPLEALVQALLIKDPNRRIQTARDVIAAIDAIPSQSAGAGWAPSPVSPRAPSSTTLSSSAGAGTYPPAAPRSKVGLIGVVAVLALAGGIAAIVATHGGDKPSAAAAPGSAVATGSAQQPVVAMGSATTRSTASQLAPTGSATPQAASTRTLQPTGSASTMTTSSAATSGSAASPAPATVTLTIESTPPDAEVLFGGVVVGKTPYRKTVPRSVARSYTVRAAGYDDRIVKVTATADAKETVTLDKKRTHVGTPPAKKTNQDRSYNPF